MSMKKHTPKLIGFYAIGATAILLAVFFLLIISGAGTYRNIVEGQAKNNRDRILLSYVLSNIKAGDAEGAVRVYEADGIPVVAVEEEGSGYGIRIYQYEGKLMGDYGKLDQALNPKGAPAIGDAETFLVENLGNGTYKVTTDVGRAFFHVRSGTD